MSDSSSSARLAALPIWQGEIEISPLLGGISNESWLVEDRAGKHVVRLGQDYPFHQVNRERELMTAEAAHQAGFSPRVEYAAPGVMVCAYIPSKTYGAPDVRANIESIALMLRRFHAQMPQHVWGAAYMFWPFHVVRDYARTLERGQSRMRPHLPEYLALANELEAVQLPLPIVFGHNDLLPANILDDGERLWLIDFEYAGFSTAMFDLAGLSSNAGFSAAESEELLALYWGRSPEPAMLRSLAAMQCASLLREAMWSMSSELYLNAPGTDYPSYTQENLQRLECALDSYRSKFGGA